MNSLSLVNLAAHSGRPSTPEGHPITLWQPSSRFVHCCIESGGCRYSREAGACVMCDYGVGRNLLPHELSAALSQSLTPYDGKIDTLLLGSYGSVLDETEISPGCFSVLLRFLSGYSVPTVIFETHCATVTTQKLAQIRQALPEQTEAIIEMGYESCDPYVLQHCLNKVLDLAQLERAIELIHEAGMSVCLNVFLGAPFLSAADQLESAKASIFWAIDHGADSLVLFPANIKPFTLMDWLHQKGLYAPLSQWMIPTLLRQLPEDILGRITLSWYGDRKNFYENDSFPLIPPKDCDRCHDTLFSFYCAFLQSHDGHQRGELVRQLWQSPLSCSCRDDLVRELQIHTTRYTSEQIKEFASSLMR